MPFTYRQLKKFLEHLDDEQLGMDVTIYSSDNDEFSQMSGFVGKWDDMPNDASWAKGILDYNHPFFIL